MAITTYRKMHDDEELKVKTNYFSMLLLATLFIGPILFAWYTHSNNSNWNVGRKNVARLINPPVSISHLRLLDINGLNINPTMLLGKWVILYLTPVDCGENCLDNLYKMHQVRLALGKNRHRTHLLIVSLPKQGENPIFKLMVNEYPRIQYANIPKASFDNLLSELPPGIQNPSQGSLFFVDPSGRLISKYPPDAAASGVLKDLRHWINR